jgi:hypothetical protein
MQRRWCVHPEDLSARERRGPDSWLECCKLVSLPVCCRTDGRGAMFRSGCYLLLRLSTHFVTLCVGGLGKAKVPYFPRLATAGRRFTKCMLPVLADKNWAPTETSSIFRQVPYRTDRLGYSAFDCRECSAYPRERVERHGNHLSASQTRRGREEPVGTCACSFAKSSMRYVLGIGLRLATLRVKRGPDLGMK